MIFHCPRCRREWEVPDHAVAHFHKCVERYGGDEDYQPRRFRVGEDRGAIWHALLNAVPDEDVLRR